MIVDAIIAITAAFGLAALLNFSVFQREPAAPWLAWALATLLFVALAIGMFMLQDAKLKSIFVGAGLPVQRAPIPSFQYVGGTALAAAAVFLATIRRRS